MVGYNSMKVVVGILCHICQQYFLTIFGTLTSSTMCKRNVLAIITIFVILNIPCASYFDYRGFDNK